MKKQSTVLDINIRNDHLGLENMREEPDPSDQEKLSAQFIPIEQPRPREFTFSSMLPKAVIEHQVKQMLSDIYDQCAIAEANEVLNKETEKQEWRSI